jgi:hypothetical protein
MFSSDELEDVPAEGKASTKKAAPQKAVKESKKLVGLSLYESLDPTSRLDPAIARHRLILV